MIPLRLPLENEKIEPPVVAIKVNDGQTDGFTSDITGHIHYLNPILHLLHIELQDGEFRRIDFTDVIQVSVAD